MAAQPRLIPMPLQLSATFWAQVDLNGPTPRSCPERGPCWLWTGARSSPNRGTVTLQRTTYLPYRLTFAEVVQRQPYGCVLHHCDEGLCVNPDHLFEGTQADNLADMSSKGRGREQSKTHCAHGHPFDEANTYWRREGGRACRKCTYERHRVAAEAKV